jgi:hypothetical protein
LIYSFLEKRWPKKASTIGSVPEYLVYRIYNWRKEQRGSLGVIVFVGILQKPMALP